MVKSNPVQNRVVKITDDIFMIVDSQDYEVFTYLACSFVKTQRCTYATVWLIINGTIRKKRVHRIVARTGPYQVCHHRNRNSLDNRWDNLLNMDPKAHDHLHRGNNLLVKFKNFSTSALYRGHNPVLIASKMRNRCVIIGLKSAKYRQNICSQSTKFWLCLLALRRRKARLAASLSSAYGRA